MSKKTTEAPQVATIADSPVAETGKTVVTPEKPSTLDDLIDSPPSASETPPAAPGSAEAPKAPHLGQGAGIVTAPSIKVGLAQTKHVEPTKVLVLRSIDPPPIIGKYNWRFEQGDFTEGMQRVVPRYVARKLQHIGALVIISDDYATLNLRPGGKLKIGESR